jgi:hypothetical protein
VTITFTGVSDTIIVSGQSQPVTLGQFQVVASGSGFVFPTPPNPNFFLFTMVLNIPVTSPTVGGAAITLFAFGGGTSLNVQTLGTDHTGFPIGPNPANYTDIVFSFHPFTIPNTSGTIPLTADVSAVPEPASMLLFASGAGLLALFRKRRGSRS